MLAVVVRVVVVAVRVMRRRVMRRVIGSRSREWIISRSREWMMRMRQVWMVWILLNEDSTVRTDDPDTITALRKSRPTRALDVDKCGRGTYERKDTVNFLRLGLITGKIRILNERETDSFSEGVGHRDGLHRHLSHHAWTTGGLVVLGAIGTGHNGVQKRSRNSMAKAQVLR